MRNKEALLESSKRHKQMLKQELATLTESSADIAKKLAIIGGIAIGSYFVLRHFFTDDDPEENKEQPPRKQESQNASSGWARVGKVLAQQALLHILAESRKTLQNYLNKLEEDDNITK